MTSLRFVDHLRELADRADVILSDIWGVVHNGLDSFPDACAALNNFRKMGGTVVLITNAPRPADSVQRQLRKLGVPDDTYDAIVSSGDLTRNFVADHGGQSMFWLGPERDNSIYRGLDAKFTPLESADYIVCTGPFDDETESAEDYRVMMTQARARDLTFVCANPDIVVERGDRLIYCAGAIAEMYREMGGEVIFYGKPHAPIYQRAVALAEQVRGKPTPMTRILAIGDSVRTDLAGAQAFGIDCLFVIRGIHAAEFDGLDQLDPAAVRELFGHPPLALTRELRWVTRFSIVRDDTPEAEIPRGAVVAMGNFDGVHLGHRAVIAAAQEMAARHGVPALAVTFEPHPRKFFSPRTPQFRLTDETAKLRLLAGAGLAGAVVMTFDKNRAGTPAQQFIEGDLIGRLGISGIAVGYDFHFGKGRTGSPALLTAEAPRLGIEVVVQPHVDIDERPVSSSAIRMALAEGEIPEATQMLGGPWFASGEVIHGEKRGRNLGYPTANIRLDPDCGLKHGIYAVRVGHGKQRFDGVASFGRRPTFDNGAPLLETFIFDFKGDLYGTTLDVAFIDFIREELKFDGIEALVKQMNDDSAKARAILAAAPDAFHKLGEIE